MMPSRTGHFELSRRIAACFLLCGLAAIVWSTAAAVLIAGGGPQAPSAAQRLREAGRWAADYGPIAVACPVLIVVLGALALRRITGPTAAIADQLRRIAAAPSFGRGDLQPLDDLHPAGMGWNRLVDALGKNGGEIRGARLEAALDGYRQQKSEQVLNSLPDGVAVTVPHGRITFANKALYGLLGLARSEESLRGKSMEECLAIDLQSPSGRQLLDPELRRRTVLVEIQHADDTSEGVLRVARSPGIARGGECDGGHVWSVRDVTQQKLADRMRDQFVAAATHELRTPLANIKAYAETLALDEVTDVEQQKEFCNTIDSEVTRLARFVDDLLQLSRMEAGSTSLNRQVTDMERLLRDAAERVRSQMQQKQLDFEVELPGKLPELVADKDKLTVALVNLLGNAAKYTPEGGKVHMQVESGEKVLRIHVEDTGIGIDAEEVPKVLDKFFRGTDPRVHQQVGSGLGLSLTQEIVRLHGGKLSVYSELNKGSKFTVTLPLTPEAAKCSNA